MGGGGVEQRQKEQAGRPEDKRKMRESIRAEEQEEAFMSIEDKMFDSPRKINKPFKLPFGKYKMREPPVKNYLFFRQAELLNIF